MAVTYTDVLIIGSGFAGTCMGIRLREAGMHDFLILEAADRLGGTWRDNHYPGAACDVPSHLYSYSFEKNPHWSRMFAPSGEILDYHERVFDKYGLRPHLRLGSEVARVEWDDKRASWEVETKGGEIYRARALINGTGALSRPAYPEIKGLDTFAGEVFHTARWRHDVSLKGKRVAVIGTGASAIQVVPAIADEVGKLVLFQRTPPWILPKPDRAITARERDLFEKVPALQGLARGAIYWVMEALAVGFVIDPRLMKPREDHARRFLARSVADPVLREKLTPKYMIGCKRILFSNDYYPALQKPQVEVITDRIVEVRKNAVVTADGTEHPVDVIVLATGFQVADEMVPFPVRGRGGLPLNEAWKDGATAYLGTTTNGFPNAFFIVGPNTGLGHSSMIYMIEAQCQYTIEALKWQREKGVRWVDVKPAVEKRYADGIQKRLQKAVWQMGGCHSWYQNKAGKNVSLWPGFTFEFSMRLRKFDPESYEHGFRSAADVTSQARAMPPQHA